MDERDVKLAAGSLLHDIGKILYRYHDGRNHSVSGYEFLKECGIDDPDILESVHYHHASLLSGAGISKNSLAYITYWADNVAAGADRRDVEMLEEIESGGGRFDKYVPLDSIFNLMNGNNGSKTYALDFLHDDGRINMPSDDAKSADSVLYGKIKGNIIEGLKAIELSGQYINSLLGVLEANLTYVPSSTDTTQIKDISLYDHMKITAAVAGCVYIWLKDNQKCDYCEVLFRNAKKTYREKIFLLYGLDTSGIQKYIYKVASDDVLKLLRAKSFYLEMLLQDVTDELLERVGLTRANLIYSGGGHAYLLLPNTERCKAELHVFEDELKKWMLESFGTDLYIAHGYTECCGNELMNTPEGSYPEIYSSLAKQMSQNKGNRYTAEDLIHLNNMSYEQSERECKVCGTTAHLVRPDGEKDACVCALCDSLIRSSSDILKPDRFIAIVSEKPAGNAVPLPFGRYMLMEGRDALLNRIRSDVHYVRSYSKNKMFTGMNMTTRIWIGDYSRGDTFHELASESKGIKRLGVYRADVDNLGQAIISGFDRKDGKTLGSLTRNASLSRKLSVFFKLHINYILEHGEYHMIPNEGEEERNALIVYSGGDDMFIVGAWNDVLEAAVDIERKFKEFTQDTLTMSGGFSVFREKYPVGPMADNVGSLEEFSKGLEGKNALTIFECGIKDSDRRKEDIPLFIREKHCYKWNCFINKVIGEKFRLLQSYFGNRPDKGMAAMYKLMAYVRNREEKINLARFAYMLGRMSPSRNKFRDREEYNTVQELHKKFSKDMYRWIRSDEDSRELLTAIYIYVYLNREGEGDHEHEQK